jgi:sugar lactone lactonase YvrE
MQLSFIPTPSAYGDPASRSGGTVKLVCRCVLALVLGVLVSVSAARAGTPPTVTSSTSTQLNDAMTITIKGVGFDATAPGNNTVSFNNGAVGAVTAATSTTLTVTFSTLPTATGALLAVVSVNGLSSGAAVQVATVLQDYTVTTLTGLSRPQDLAFDSSNNLFVTNYLANTVSKFAPGATTTTATLTGLNGPTGLAFDSSGNLYVSNQAGTTVSKFAPGATTPSATLTGLTQPGYMAFDSSGNLFVISYPGNTVSRFAPGATTPTATLTGLNGPADLAFDSSGNLFVSSFSGNTVSKFAPGATTPTAYLTGLDGPNYLAFDSLGNLFVGNGNFTASTVSKFAPGATTPSATLAVLGIPAGLAFDSSGNLFVATLFDTTVRMFAPGATTPTATLTGLDGPGALAFDRSANLCVININANTVSKFTFTRGMPGFTAWRLANFGTNSLSGNLADTSSYLGDGIPNLLKYALGHSPLVAAPPSVLPGIVQGSANSLLNDRLAIRFTLPNPAPADVTYTVQATDDLVHWTTVATKQGTGAWVWNTSAGGSTPHIVDPGTSPDTVQMGDFMPATGNTKRMMRLQVSGP